MQASFASVNLGAGAAARPAARQVPDSSADSSGVTSDEESLAGHGTAAKVTHTEARTLARLAPCTYVVVSSGLRSARVTLLDRSMYTCFGRDHSGLAVGSA